MNTVLVTYIYPEAVKFFPDFIKTVNEQTNQNFTIHIFNDGVKNVKKFFHGLSGGVEITNLEGSISEIRFKSLEILKNSKSDFIIFQDIDDLMSKNRIQITLKLLENRALVCNDLSLFSKGEIKETNIWQKRLGKIFEFNYKFLEDKNIVGFGNTAIRRELLNFDLKISNTPIAVDWFVFYQILLKHQQTVLFTSECTTIYRQHEDNIIGITDDLSTERQLTILNGKIAHYKALNEIGINFSSDLEKIEDLNERLKISNNIHKKPNTEAFWWEQINFYETN
ncbi:glycosyl transferase family 2 [Christiangramia gaetbulicola]|uniref:Glycosyl transferase family 2 n=1 Tax=Christiangramia gaetbulicola TaxID=703340 RepID=A0A2T6AFP0_9FLAO|nr:glycosyltransferase [Christiangramia gaetbulicola]PTX42606.1 glycosyl transferase family 2 [Christiangramia gaetbulicola]